MVRSTDLFLCFFALTDRSSFERKKKDLTKLPGPRSLAEVKHFGGKANVSITQEKVALGHNINSFGIVIQGLYDKLAKANDDTVKITRLLAEAYSREAETFKELSMAYASIEV